MSSKTIRIDDEVHALILEEQNRSLSEDRKQISASQACLNLWKRAEDAAHDKT